MYGREESSQIRCRDHLSHVVMFLPQKTMEQDEWNGVQQAVHNLLLLWFKFYLSFILAIVKWVTLYLAWTFKNL